MKLLFLALAAAALAPGQASAAQILYGYGSQRPGSEPHSRLWVMRPNGSHKRRLATPVDTGAGDFARKKLLWEADPARSGSTKWLLGDRNGRHGKLVAKRRGAGGTWLSPDAHRLETADESAIAVIDLRTKRIKTFDGLYPGGWSADSRHILAATGPQMPSCTPIPVPGAIPCPPPSYSLDDVDVETGASRTVATFSGDEVNGARWSPDGREILFLRTPADGDPSQLWLMKADGSGAHLATQLHEVDGAVWAPDGKRIALLAGTRGKDYIATIRPDGTGLRKLTRTYYGLSLNAWG